MNKQRNNTLHQKGHDSREDVPRFVETAEFAYPRLDRALGGDGKELTVRWGNDSVARELEREKENNAHLQYYLYQEEEKNDKLRSEKEEMRQEIERLRESLHNEQRTCHQWAERSDYFEAKCHEADRQLHSKRVHGEDGDDHDSQSNKRPRSSCQGRDAN